MDKVEEDEIQQTEESTFDDIPTNGGEKHANCVQAFVVDDFLFDDCGSDEIQSRVDQWIPLQSIDEQRHPLASSSGGKVCRDKRIISSMRSVGKYVIAQIGKKILSGDMNLTKISFPIRGMIAKSGLEKNLQSSIFFPLYVNRACQEKSRLERVKLVITACLATFHVNLSFLKPLNPILGETIQGHLNDGTQLFAEQMSHHPPICYFYCIGPNENYKYFGHYNYEASSRVNSITLKNKGKRTVRFRDGQTIIYSIAYEQYSGTIFGQTKVETLGSVTFQDKENDIVATIRFGKVKKKPTDYFQGQIMMQGVTVGQIYGSYMGFLEFDGIRYWDFRQVPPYKVHVKPPTLQSDPQHRHDYQYLSKLDIDKAQSAKEYLEEIQRRDAKLRQKHLDFLKKKDQ